MEQVSAPRETVLRRIESLDFLADIHEEPHEIEYDVERVAQFVDEAYGRWLERSPGDQPIQFLGAALVRFVYLSRYPNPYRLFKAKAPMLSQFAKEVVQEMELAGEPHAETFALMGLIPFFRFLHDEKYVTDLQKACCTVERAIKLSR